MMAKGTYAGILLATADFDGTFARLQAAVAAFLLREMDAKHPVWLRSSAETVS
jgi:hypothetical protein